MLGQTYLRDRGGTVDNGVLTVLEQCLARVRVGVGVRVRVRFRVRVGA